MALPPNYKQVAVGANSAPATTAPSGSRSRASGSGAGGSSERNKDSTQIIFTHSNYGNPAFTPQKAGKSSSNRSQTNDSRTPKPPKPPEKPVLPYMRYSKRVWELVKSQYPDLKLWELGKKIGAQWKQLDESEKQEYIDEYEAEKVEYEKALKAYHNSPAYQSYIAAKSKVKTDADVHETPIRASGQRQQERRIDIQPAEDEDDKDDGNHYKHVAFQRYLHNHLLINEIFSDVVVPDVRSVVTTQRMQVLKRQVSSLTMHQTKLEAELQQMEEKFEAKKQRMMESSAAFQEELKRHCRPAVDEETIQKMAQRMYEEMKRDRQRLEESLVNAAESATPAVVSGPGPAAEAAPAANVVVKEVTTADSNTIAATSTENKITAELTTDSKTEPEPMDIEPSVETAEPIKPEPKPEIDLKLKVELSAAAANDENIKENKLMVNTTPPVNRESPTPAAISTTPPAAAAAEQSTTLDALATTVNQTQLQQQIPQTQTNAQQQPTQTTLPTQPPQQQQQQQQQQSTTGAPTTAMVTHAHGQPQPSPHHMAPHMTPHQAPTMSGLSPHNAYGSYATPPARSPYYQPQYGPTPPHPTQSYGQYSPYTHYQQSPYGPPPPPTIGSQYLNSARPPPQHNGAYGETATGQQQTGHAVSHEVYGQQSAAGTQSPSQGLPTTGVSTIPAQAATALAPSASDTVQPIVEGVETKTDTDKKENN